MVSTFGIYRIAAGAEIIQSSFDYETSQIGPIKLPFKLNYIETELSNRFPIYKFYEALLADETALAVFNVNNYCLCVVTRTQAYQTPATPTPKLDLQSWWFKQPLQLPIYEHIGYVKTYQNCLAVSKYPNYLLREVASNKAIGFDTLLEGKPQIQPQLTLYKELINTDAAAVYFDEITQQPKFLYY